MHVERMSDKRQKRIKIRGRPLLTFENLVSNILEEGHVKRMRTPRRAFMKRLTTVDEVREVYRD